MQKRVEPGTGRGGDCGGFGSAQDMATWTTLPLPRHTRGLRQQNEKLGERRVRNDLKQKGIHAI